MGSGHSSDTHAYTYIDTDVSSFSPGSWVGGVVKILIEKPTHIGKISIQLTCIGESRWDDESSDHYTCCFDKKLLSRIQFPIYTFDNELPEGQFELPFSIQLPTDLKPSFKYEFCTVYGKLEYFFEAVIDNPKAVESLQTIVWVNKFPDPNIEIKPVSVEGTLRVKSCCCLGAGNTDLKATLNTNTAMNEDEVSITLNIVNTMNRYSVNKVTYSLNRCIRLKARHKSGVDSTVFTSLSLKGSKDVNIKAGQSDVPNVIINMSLKEDSELWMMPTVASDVVDCEYFLKLGLCYNNFMGFDMYEIALPLEICNGRLVINTKLSAAPDVNLSWDPTVLVTEPIKARNYESIEGECSEKSQSGDSSQDQTLLESNSCFISMKKLHGKIVPQDV